MTKTVCIGIKSLPNPFRQRFYIIFIHFLLYKMQKLMYNRSVDGAWRSLVARTAGGREVAGSNPVAPIFIRVRRENGCVR